MPDARTLESFFDHSVSRPLRDTQHPLLWAQNRLAAMRHLDLGPADPCTSHGMTPVSPNSTFVSGEAMASLQARRIPLDFQRADLQVCSADQDDAAPRSKVSEAQEPTLQTLILPRGIYGGPQPSHITTIFAAARFPFKCARLVEVPTSARKNLQKGCRNDMEHRMNFPFF